MEDDIDIEEHDVLEHPRIKNIFPDLTRIKTEVPDDEYEEQSMDYESSYEMEASSKQNPDAEYTRHSNRIILGSKPANSIQITEDYVNGESVLIFGRKPLQIKQEIQEFEEDGQEIPGHSSVLILGSKPSHKLLNEDELDEEIDDDSIDQNKTLESVSIDNLRPSIVMVEDWGPKLENNPCYCRDCEILFPTSNTLLAHNMTAHSFLVAVENNKAFKSTSKIKKPVDSGKYCNHCNKLFPDSNSLINHLYDNLTFNKNNAALKSDMNAPKTMVGPLKSPIKPVASTAKSHVDLKVNSVLNLELSKGDEIYFYRCAVCSSFFKNRKSYIKHMDVNHSCKKMDMSVSPFDGQCKLCTSVFNDKAGYNKHIVRQHNLVYYEKDKPIKFTKFQCQKCSEIFTSYNATKLHRRLKHPNLKYQTLINRISYFSNGPSINVQKARIVPSKLPISKSIQKPETTNSFAKITNPPIPKSVLFKCVKCQIHFTTCTAAILHTKSCLRYKGDWKCQICRKNFKVGDIPIHRLQHQSSDKFTVYVCNDNMYGRVLNKCPDCRACFHEKKFWEHCKNDCKGGSANCEVCNLPIHASCMDEHETWHEKLGTTREDIILVEFEKSNLKVAVPNTVKRKVTEETEVVEVAPKKSKVESLPSDATVAYYCEKCQCFTFTARYKIMHLEGICKKLMYQRLICNLCGLMYSSKTHDNYHKENPGQTIMKMKFMKFGEKGYINPPIPEYPKCKKCNVHFCKKKTLGTHSCHDAQKTCKYCKKKFSDLAYNLHIRFHEYHEKGFKQISKKSDEGITSAPSDLQVMPELLKKYQEMTNIWNILYLCDTCDLIYDSYDLAVEHCQKHYNNMENYDVIVKYCNICDLKFDEICFQKHQEFHTSNKTINKSSFQILNYSYTDLLSKQWNEIFAPLTKDLSQQIISKSIYSNTRTVKMRVVKDGVPEMTMYRCGKCEKYVHPLSVNNHYKLTSCHLGLPFTCRKCYLPFGTNFARKHHESFHEAATKKEFKIVYFNEHGYEEFDKKLRENDQNLDQHLKHYTKLYMCSKCKCCLSAKDKIPFHECNGSCQRKNCGKCNLRFSIASYRNHLKLHEAYPRLQKDNIKITMFRSHKSALTFFSPKEKENTVKLYKCVCGLHFISAQASETHFKICKTSKDISKDNCSKCGRLFDTTQLFNHLCKHHSSDKNTKFEIVTLKESKEMYQVPKSFRPGDIRKTLFKCVDCEVYYLSYGGVRYHMSCSHDNSKVVPCPKCELNFMPKTLEKHKRLHHSVLKCRKTDFNIMIVTENSFNELPADVKQKPIKRKTVKQKQLRRKISQYHYSNKILQNLKLNRYNQSLYKCQECTLHFLTKSTYETHKTYCSNSACKVKCDICRLEFSMQSLGKHKYVHHTKMKLKRNDFCIKTLKKHTLLENDGKDKKEKEEEETAEENSSKSFVDEDSSDEKYMILKYDERKSDIDTSEVTDNTISNKSFKFTNIIFKCYCGLHFLQENSIHSHKYAIHDRGNKPPTETCKECNLKFTVATLFKHKTLHHDINKVSVNDLYVISYKRTLHSIGTNHLYRCIHCDAHFTKLSALKYHNHEVSKIQCDQCNLWICHSVTSYHTAVQHGQMKLSYEDFVILQNNDFGELIIIKEKGNKNTLITNKLRPRIDKKNYSFGSNDDLQESNDEEMEVDKNEDSKIQKERSEPLAQISNTNLEFSEPTDNVDTTNDKAYLYGCGVCSINFLKVNSLICHAKKPNHCPAKNKFLCNTCGLWFTDITLVKHNMLHHKQMKLKREDIRVTIYDVLTQNSNALYQCDECSINFMNPESLLKHISVCSKTKNIVKCDSCGLKFGGITLKRHIELQHEEMGYKYEDLVIYDSNMLPLKLKDCSDQSENVLITDESAPKEISDKISTLNTDLYTNKLYKCTQCSIAFLTPECLEWHTKNSKHNLIKSNCTFCGFAFTVETLPTHVFIHHDKLNLSAEHFCVSTNSEDSYLTDKDNAIDSVTEMEKHVKTPKTYRASSKKQSKSDSGTTTKSVQTPSTSVANEQFDNDEFNKKSTGDDLEDSVASSISQDDEMHDEKDDSDISQSLDVTDTKNSPIKLYKCGECNVCFLTQPTCYKHIIRHTPLDQKDYIECKLCGYQFIIINSLHKHMIKHHTKPFRPEDVLIEEYQPNILCHGSPKIEIYLGTDRLQSKLISTTSENNVDTDNDDTTISNTVTDNKTAVVKSNSSHKS